MPQRARKAHQEGRKFCPVEVKLKCVVKLVKKDNHQCASSVKRMGTHLEEINPEPLAMILHSH
jgi:hypothetical protein